MADIRIKDLTTLASASLTGDVFVIDGTTGARKLSAFSPTFGGSVVATGGLTSSGPISTSVGITANEGTFTGGYAVLRNYGGSADTGALFLGQSGNSNFVSGTLTTIANYIGGAAICSTVAAGFRVLTTTASTTTSTGALVVSGGVGVGGAITLGSSLTSTASDGKIVVSGSGNTTGTKELQFVRADGGDSTVLGLAGSAYAGVLTGLGNNDAYLYTSSAYAFRIFVGTTNRFDFTSSQFKINPTTISNSTSSGALVVSGGVGVGGAINAGGAITSNNGSGSGLLGMRSSSGNASYVFWSETGVADRGILGFNNGSSTLSYRSGASSFSTGAEVFSVGSDGTITSTTSTNSGVLQLNLVNSSTGTSASSLFRFNAGTRTATLQAYNDTHATLAGQLRVGTSNGDIVLIPSGVTATTFGSSTVTVNHSTASASTSSGALVVSGGVGVGGAINAGDQIKSERTSGTDTASAVLGVLTTTGAGVTNSFGIDARVIVNNSSGTTTSATGLRALSRVSNVSTVTQAVAMLAQVDNPGGGTITTAYGLYVNPITAGGTNYAIYTGGGRINFQSLPTSSAGLAAGTIWNDGGTLKVA